MGLPPDPRVPGGSTYDRDNVIQAVTSFYKLLSALPYVDPSHILYPPSEGWSNVKSDVIQDVFHKTDEVLELLQHLPYLKQDRGMMTEYLIGPDIIPCDYRQEAMVDGATEQTKALVAPPSAAPFPPWTIPLAIAKSRSGRHVILDTSDGTVTEYDIEGVSYDPDYGSDDPRAWRDKCRWAEEPMDRTLTVIEYFQRLSKRFQNLEWIGFWRMNRSPNLWLGYDFTYTQEEEETEELRKIMITYGWPQNFRREDCKQAMIAWETLSRENITD